MSNSQPQVVVLISANIEWRVLLEKFYPDVKPIESPLGQWFETEMDIAGRRESVLFFHGGWGKIAAAASTQYVIDRWAPNVVLNMGTCGGFFGDIECGEIVLVERVIVYDIVEQMTDPTEALAHFTTNIDLSWLEEPYPQPVRRTLLVSADRDLVAQEVPGLKARFGAVAGDWESGAIAWASARNNTRCLILRGVTDLVGGDGGQAYDGNLHVFIEGTEQVFANILPYLSQWISRALAGL